jgi:hypothetical protein
MPTMITATLEIPKTLTASEMEKNPSLFPSSLSVQGLPSANQGQVSGILSY